MTTAETDLERFSSGDRINGETNFVITSCSPSHSEASLFAAPSKCTRPDFLFFAPLQSFTSNESRMPPKPRLFSLSSDIALAACLQATHMEPQKLVPPQRILAMKQIAI